VRLQIATTTRTNVLFPKRTVVFSNSTELIWLQPDREWFLLNRWDENDRHMCSDQIAVWSSSVFERGRTVKIGYLERHGMLWPNSKALMSEWDCPKRICLLECRDRSRTSSLRRKYWLVNWGNGNTDISESLPTCLFYLSYFSESMNSSNRVYFSRNCKANNHRFPPPRQSSLDRRPTDLISFSHQSRTSVRKMRETELVPVHSVMSLMITRWVWLCRSQRRKRIALVWRLNRVGQTKYIEISAESTGFCERMFLVCRKSGISVVALECRSVQIHWHRLPDHLVAATDAMVVRWSSGS
jgi:hypothetical protein